MKIKKCFKNKIKNCNKKLTNYYKTIKKSQNK